MGFRKVIIDCILHISYFTVYVLKISLVMYSRSKELVCTPEQPPREVPRKWCSENLQNNHAEVRYQ